jgi:hypothetical protein
MIRLIWLKVPETQIPASHVWIAGGVGMKATPVLLLTLAALLLSACGSVKIARIAADPSRFQNKTVRVNGTVTNSFGALGTGAYQVDDGTGKLYVISSTGVPSKGSQVAVTGNVINGITVMGKSVGLALREHKHKVD